MPPHEEPLYSAGVWYCKYLYFVNEDGVAPGEGDFFFRAFERGRFTRKRLGRKKYGDLMKEVAAFNGYDPSRFSGILIFSFFGFLFFFVLIFCFF